MNSPDFYLASTEGYGLGEPRRCWKMKRLRSPTRDDLLLIRVAPPLVGQKYGMGAKDVEYLIVATRHNGDSLFPIENWPVHVHVARLLKEPPEEQNELREEDIEAIAWAELYRSEEDARERRL